MNYNKDNVPAEYGRNYEEEAALTEYRFQIPDYTHSDFSNEDLEEDFEGIPLSFKKLKIPSGGSKVFEEPSSDPENPMYSKTVQGVILYSHPAYAYWEEGEEFSDNAAPLCSSIDGNVGIGTPGGLCETCVYNRYGSDVNGKGKACKNMRNLYILRDGEFMPILLSLPPTSLRPFREFTNATFMLRRRPIWSAVIQISLRRVENGANSYSVAAFKKLYDFTGEQLQQIREIAADFRSQIKTYNQTRAIDAESRIDPNSIYETDASYTDTGDNEHFCIQYDEQGGNKKILSA